MLVAIETTNNDATRQKGVICRHGDARWPCTSQRVADDAEEFYIPTLRKCRGVVPVHRLNDRKKLLGSE
jgi:hypothetical protein